MVSTLVIEKSKRMLLQTMGCLHGYYYQF